MSISSAGASSSPFTTTSPSSGSAIKPKQQETAEQKFLDYANMTPAQRMFNTMLNQLGISQDQFDAMSPDEQQKVTQKIQQMIQQQAQNGGARDAGLVTDKTV